MNTVDNAPVPFASLIFAHGAGAGKDSEFMRQTAALFSERGVSVIRFDFPYMKRMQESGKRRPPDRMPVLCDHFERIIEQYEDQVPLFIGGKSMGARVASMVVSQRRVAGAIAFGYPFHPPGKPENLRTDHLYELDRPMLIVQGERDTFGRQAEVLSYQLPDTIEACFVTDGDHSFKPRKASGLSVTDNLTAAVDRSVDFMRALTGAQYD